ncbi:MAG TPA: hypothetical protein VF069_11045 [Streptosporangiaceae bacterium]
MAALLIAPGAWQGAARAAVAVPCSTAALISAINTANAAGTPQTLDLSPGCTYTLTVPAAFGTRGGDGLPIITGNITINGHDAVIRRTSAALFRIFEVAGTLTVRNLNIFGGDAGPNTGGAILSAHGTVTVIESAIVHNVADSGAGISNDRGRLTLVASWVRANSTIPSAGGGGGGIYNDGTMVSQQGSITLNNANTAGGGVYNELGGTIRFEGTYVNGNKAKQRGGGVYNGVGGTIRFNDGQVKYNRAGLFGGGIYNANGTTAIVLNNTNVHVNEPSNCAPSNTVPNCFH